MKITLKAILLFVTSLTFSQFSFANESYDIARELAAATKQGLIKQYGNFPIKLDKTFTLRSVTSFEEFIVYDYYTKESAKDYPQSLLKMAAKINFDKSACKVDTFVNLFTYYDIKIAYRYSFSDGKPIYLGFDIDDLCGE